MKIGLCHCADCRKTSGSAFVAYADFPPEAFTSTGRVAIYDGRSFCPACGSRVFSLSDHQAEIMIGAFDVAPSDFTPTREGWVKRREHWLPPVAGVAQFDEDPV
jgi:hypothetical protein